MGCLVSLLKRVVGYCLCGAKVGAVSSREAIHYPDIPKKFKASSRVENIHPLSAVMAFKANRV